MLKLNAILKEKNVRFSLKRNKLIFVSAFHKTGLDTRSMTRWSIIVGI